MQAYNSYLTDNSLSKAMAMGMRSRPRFQQPMQTGGTGNTSTGGIVGPRFPGRPPYQSPPWAPQMGTGFGASSLPNTSGLHPVGPANNDAPLPMGGGSPIGPIDIPPATGGNPPTTAPFPSGPPTGGNYEPGQTAPGAYPGIYDNDPMPGVSPHYFPPYMPIGNDPDMGGGRFGPGGMLTDPNAPDRLGGSGPGGWSMPGTTPAGIAYGINASNGFAQGPFSEGATSVAGAGGWKYLTHKPALQA